MGNEFKATAVSAAFPGVWRARLALAVLALVVLIAVACSDGALNQTDDGAPWTIDNAVDVGFEKGEQLEPGPAKVLDAWVGTFNGARVELYRHGLGEFGNERPVDPTWLHRRLLADDCCNFWQRNRLTAICELEEQACKALREALDAAFPI